MMSDGSPGELEVYGYFSAHLGPRSVAAGLRIQFLYNQSPGIHFRGSLRKSIETPLSKVFWMDWLCDFPSYPPAPAFGSPRLRHTR